LVPFFPAPTATAQISVTPAGTVKVPDDVNTCCPAGATVMLAVGFLYNGVTSKWRCMGVA
jgi:hypothetical protein